MPGSNAHSGRFSQKVTQNASRLTFFVTSTTHLIMEIWQPIPEFTKYHASTLGRIKNVATKQLMHPTPRKIDGYGRLALYHNNKRQDFYVHQLILWAFKNVSPVQMRELGLITRHLNGNSDDNSLANLALGLPFHNSQDQRRHDRTHKLTRKQRASIADKYAQGKATRELALEHGVCVRTIWNYIRKHKTST